MSGPWARKDLRRLQRNFCHFSPGFLIYKPSLRFNVLLLITWETVILPQDWWTCDPSWVRVYLRRKEEEPQIPTRSPFSPRRRRFSPPFEVDRSSTLRAFRSGRVGLIPLAPIGKLGMFPG